MANDIQRRLRRAKDSERRMGRWLLDHDGPDPRLRPGGGIVTSTGRVGHVTGLQFDTLSATYAGENKQIKVWAGLWAFWKQIVDRARDQRKEPLLRIEPTNLDKAKAPVMHVITEERHAQLLAYEKQAIVAGNCCGANYALAVERDEVKPKAAGGGFPRRASGPITKEAQAGKKKARPPR